jgi:hypothetical protein
MWNQLKPATSPGISYLAKGINSTLGLALAVTAKPFTD